jgi:hypothetical protein
MSQCTERLILLRIVTLGIPAGPVGGQFGAADDSDRATGCQANIGVALDSSATNQMTIFKKPHPRITL